VVAEQAGGTLEVSPALRRRLERAAELGLVKEWSCTPRLFSITACTGEGWQGTSAHAAHAYLTGLFQGSWAAWSKP
jgi:hypothetical protein